MNLRQPLFKDAHNFFRFRRWQLSNTCIIQRNCGEIICKQSMSSKANVTQADDASLDSEQEVIDSGLPVLAPIDVGVDKRVTKLRLRAKNRVEEAIRNKYGKRFTVEFFGSIRYGVANPKSDLDLVVIDPKLPLGIRRLNGLGAIYNVKTLGRTLHKAGFTHVDVRASASVPIVKLHDPATGLDCDINVNDRLGLHNSSMINEYCDAHPFLRPLLYRIKKWAKPLGLNSPSPGPSRCSASFSSYALALMTISFLQKGGHLPNLQENLPPFTAKPQLMWTRKPHKGWDVRYHSAKDWVPPPLPDFDTLVSLWYSYWIDFPYEMESISIRDGGTSPRISPPPPTPKKNREPRVVTPAPICVSDPFILTKNVTASISNRVLDTFIKECRIGVGLE